MVTLEQLRELMKKKAEEDRAVNSVTVSGNTLEEALSQAATELGLRIKQLEYDVIQRGSTGVLGMGRKPWSLIVYQTAKKVAAEEAGDFHLLDQSLQMEVQEVVKDKDGECFVRLWADGVYVKVTKPIGAGNEVTEEEALDIIHQRAVREINRQALKGTVKLALGNYVKVGEFIHNPANDALMTVVMEDQEMRALISVQEPAAGGADLSREDVEQFLRNNGIVHGILSKEIEAFIDKPEYRTKVLVAEGTKPVHGKDAKIQYFFDTTTVIKPKEVEGKVDFKNLNTIHNVVKGEELARKEPAERGGNGRTTTGRILPARDGRDVEFELGNNVALSKDGLRVTSTADGQVILVQRKISVETVLIIPGDVNLSTGNVNVYGAVIIKGNVEDGFSVKAAGNIEVLGTVGKSVLETPGDIIVHQGIKGGGGGSVSAGLNVWSKFIENAYVNAGGFVISSDGIVNAQLTALKKVICKGKRAKIMGGHVRAAEEINVSSLGSTGSGETILEVGFDPKGKKELEELQAEKDALDKAVSEDGLNLQGLMKLARVRGGTLPPDKDAAAKQLQKKIKAAQQRLLVVNQELDQKLKDMDSLRLNGKVSCSGLVYPGVKIIIKDAEFDVVREYNGVTFVLEGAIIRTIKYEEIEEEELDKIRRS